MPTYKWPFPLPADLDVQITRFDPLRGVANQSACQLIGLEVLEGRLAVEVESAIALDRQALGGLVVDLGMSLDHILADLGVAPAFPVGGPETICPVCGLRGGNHDPELHRTLEIATEDSEDAG